MPHWLGQSIFFIVYAVCVIGLLMLVRPIFWFVVRSLLFLSIPLVAVSTFLVVFLKNLFTPESPFEHVKVIKRLQKDLDDLDEQIATDSNDFFFKESLKQKERVNT